nr:hypothetical protein Iba_chr13bCG1020 [Ipomoea batatas]GMD77282.1 hypothetical protein Iba_chr13cCG1840 [Ipomoea batatas]GMD95227.1 hypothetical protein Iba_chr15aCG10280 [Ipomoea batatas]
MSSSNVVECHIILSTSSLFARLAPTTGNSSSTCTHGKPAAAASSVQKLSSISGKYSGDEFTSSCFTPTAGASTATPSVTDDISLDADDDLSGEDTKTFIPVDPSSSDVVVLESPAKSPATAPATLPENCFLAF